MKEPLPDELSKRIIAGNLELHRQEAPYYDQTHGEIFNWFEQHLLRKDLALIKKLTPGWNALDVGCGTGNITLKLLRAGFHVTALDLSQPMLDILASKVETGGDSLRLVCEDIDSFLANTPETYDVVTVSAVLHHLPDYLATMSHILTKINPGGLVTISHEPSGRLIPPMPGRDFLSSLDCQVSNWLAGRQRPVFDWSYSDYHVYHGFDSSTVIECISRAGFRIIRKRFYSASMQLGISNLIINLIYRTKEHFSLLGQAPRQAQAT